MRDVHGFHPFDEESRTFMEYVRGHGAFADAPLERIVSAWEVAYGRDRVQGWIRALEGSGGRSGRNGEL